MTAADIEEQLLLKNAVRRGADAVEINRLLTELREARDTPRHASSLRDHP